MFVQVKGPFPKFDYKPNVKKEIGMLAGGTGECFTCVDLFQFCRQNVPLHRWFSFFRCGM